MKEEGWSACLCLFTWLHCIGPEGWHQAQPSQDDGGGALRGLVLCPHNASFLVVFVQRGR